MPNIKALGLVVSDKTKSKKEGKEKAYVKCDPRGNAFFGPRGIIFGTNVVEIHQMMSHTKYQGSRPCGFS